MPITRFHNIVGSSSVNAELLAPGDNASKLKSIVIANVHATTEATVSLFIQDNPASGSSSTFYIMKTVAIPSDTSLVLEEHDIPSFSNSISGYGLYATVGSSDTVDVLLNI